MAHPLACVSLAVAFLNGGTHCGGTHSPPPPSPRAGAGAGAGAGYWQPLKRPHCWGLWWWWWFSRVTAGPGPAGTGTGAAVLVVLAPVLVGAALPATRRNKRRGWPRWCGSCFHLWGSGAGDQISGGPCLAEDLEQLLRFSLQDLSPSLQVGGVIGELTANLQPVTNQHCC